jgi:hypothetical protein
VCMGLVEPAHTLGYGPDRALFHGGIKNCHVL